MKIFTLQLLILAAAFLSPAVVCADPLPAAKPVVHPGMLHSKAELAFVEQKVAVGEEPWKSAWEKRRPGPPSTTHMSWGTGMFYCLPRGLNPIEVNKMDNAP